MMLSLGLSVQFWYSYNSYEHTVFLRGEATIIHFGFSMDPSTRKRAEEFLPGEMWNKVAGYLDKEEDIMRGYRTCNILQDLLRPKVFSQALQLVQRHVSGTRLQLEESDLLSCRLVCRDWRKMINHFFQSRPSRLDLACYRARPIGFQQSFTDQVINAPNRFGAICLHLNKLEEAHSLVERIVGNVRTSKDVNVLCGRHLVVVCPRGCFNKCQDVRDPEKQRFYDLVSRLLNACGKHIWYFSMCDAISEGLPHWTFNTFWKWLHLMPNLKMLTCQITTAIMFNEQRLEVQKELEAGMVKQPCPPLPCLRTVQCNGAPDIVLQSLLTVNRNVNKLEVVPFQYRGGLTLDIHLWRITALTEFCIIICKVEELHQLTEKAWPLEKLTLRFAFHLGPLHARLEDHIEGLGAFGTSLKYLRMELPNRIPNLEERQWILRLPHLEELHLDVMHHARLDFMLPCQSLRKVRLSVTFYDVDMDPHVVFRNGITPMSNLYVTSIFESLLTLQEVEVQMFKCVSKTFIKRKYTRKEKYSGKYIIHEVTH